MSFTDYSVTQVVLANQCFVLRATVTSPINPAPKVQMTGENIGGCVKNAVAESGSRVVPALPIGREEEVSISGSCWGMFLLFDRMNLLPALAME